MKTLIYYNCGRSLAGRYRDHQFHARPGDDQRARS